MKYCANLLCSLHFGNVVSFRFGNSLYSFAEYNLSLTHKLPQSDGTVSQRNSLKAAKLVPETYFQVCSMSTYGFSGFQDLVV